MCTNPSSWSCEGPGNKREELSSITSRKSDTSIKVKCMVNDVCPSVPFGAKMVLGIIQEHVFSIQHKRFAVVLPVASNIN